MKELTPCQQIERSIHKKFRKTIWKPFVAGVQKYGLIQEGDKVACCISGGKDSMLMAKLLQNLHRITKIPFELSFVVMDPGYNEINRQRVIDNASLLEIPITIFESDIFDVVAKTDRSPCYLCAKMRRGYLYAEAQRLGCNKIALGHHFNDVVETVIMSIFYGGKFQTMMPKLPSTNFPGMELIRPMYRVHEEQIISWKNYNDLEFIQCACRFAENCTLWDDGGEGSKRQEVKTLLKRLKKDNPSIEKNIFNSIHDVNLDTIIGYKQKGQLISFLDYYEQNDGNDL
ncbi:MAG: tRNA 2-thiocytidine biosynthesis protein TtcA [Defluviitaleaceae bacterium]|nr:tRNA 2-thiocytidine biosynthesis protein TtcA [Defluviitaleaceae bacterium]